MNGSEPWIQTVSGGRFYPLDPRPWDVNILDIGHALANVCRFTGHTLDFYSVAQHSVMVSELLPDNLKLWGLLHDASEAYIQDIARPVKKDDRFAFYREVEKRVMDSICLAYGLPCEEPPEVKDADLRVLAAEARDLMPQREHAEWDWMPDPAGIPKIKPWPPKRAKAYFLDAFFEITGDTRV